MTVDRPGFESDGLSVSPDFCCHDGSSHRAVCRILPEDPDRKEGRDITHDTATSVLLLVPVRDVGM